MNTLNLDTLNAPVDPMEAARVKLVRILTAQLSDIVRHNHDDVRRILSELRAIAARENLLLMLFCLHAAIEAIRLQAGDVEGIHETNEACAELATDFAGFWFQEARP